MIELTSSAKDGCHWKALFDPGRGMHLRSLSYGERELLSQRGGEVVGPHFGEQRYHPLAGDRRYFQGVARYVPWEVVSADEKHLFATLKGGSLCEGIALSARAGFSFTMAFRAVLGEHLEIELSVVGEADCLVGLEYDWNLPDSKLGLGIGGDRGRIMECDGKEKQWLIHPEPNPLECHLALKSSSYTLALSYRSPSQENSCYLHYMPSHRVFSWRPYSAKDPFHPNLTVSSLHFAIAIAKGEGS